MISAMRSTSDFTSSTEVAAPRILDMCSSITLFLIPIAVSRNSTGIWFRFWLTTPINSSNNSHRATMNLAQFG